ncbi:MAG: 50S ribosomal protein L11 methyltransferase [bacterium]
MNASRDALLTTPAALFVVRAETTRAVAEAVQLRTEMLENLALVVWLDEDQPRGRLESFHATPAAAEAALAVLQAELDTLAPGAGAAAAVAVLPPEDWAESWKRHFKTEHISERLWVKPTWETCAAADGEIVIELDPGLSFGTGQHGTTRACLRLLDACARHSVAGRLTDLGAGSGILAIAAAKLGWMHVLAVDNDPVAVRIAGANAAANGVAAAVTVCEGDLAAPSSDWQAETVVANILAAVLIEHSAAVADCVAPGGQLILSGILDNQYAAVREAYQSLGFRERQAITLEGWCSGWFDAPSRISNHAPRGAAS